MRILILITRLTVTCIALQAQAALPFSYKVSDSNPDKNTSIQTISFKTISGTKQDAIRKTNAALMVASLAFRKEAKECGAAAQGHPWEYQINLEKVLRSKKYLSVVFAKRTVCAGSPVTEKEARVFSLPTGTLIPARALFKRVLPAKKLATNAPSNKDLIDLDEEMSETMINDSKKILKNYDTRCDFYLKNSSYRLWMDGKNLILFPEFIQSESACQKEYVIQTED